MTVLSYLSCFVVSCNEPDEYEDVEVTILSTSNYSQQKAIVRYTVENTGTKTINGWKIVFFVHFSSSQQLSASEKVYYTLEPDDISSARVVQVQIPEYYNEGALNASFNFIETW